MTSNDIRTFLDVMDKLRPGLAIRRGTDGFWYAAFVPRIVPPQEVNWRCYRNPLDAMQHEAALREGAGEEGGDDVLSLPTPV